MADRATIKSYFETGKKPTQAEFAEWIDHTFDAPQLAIDTAEEALEAVEATLPLCMGALRVEIASNYAIGSGGHTETKFRQQDCTFTITHNGASQTSNPASGPKAYKATFQIDVTFTTAAANTNFTANYALTNKTLAGCRFFVELSFLLLAPGTGHIDPQWDNVMFMIWPG